MRKGTLLLGFFILQLACADARVGLSSQKGGTWQAFMPRCVKTVYAAEKEKVDPVDPHQWDFGQVKQGVILKHDFILKNETHDILGINNIHTSCGCTVSESAKKSLMPQESTAISVSFNSKGYSGVVTQFVYVHTDNVDLAIIKFTIKAQVVKED